MGKLGECGAPLQTGDILLFSGKSGSSESIKWATFNPWSHVAMVLVLPQYGFPCLWEATTDTNLACLDSGQFRSGVQLVPLAARVQHYEGDVALRRLLDVQLAEARLQPLHALRRMLAGRAYEQDKLELMAAAYDGPFGEQGEDLRELFCSELTAAAYRALGLLRAGTGGKPCNEYVPADFSEEDEDLPWLEGRLGPQIPLKWS
jgi:hypothetical protein